MNGQFSVIRPFNGHAHITECLQGGKRIFPFQKSSDIGHACRKAAQHNAAMRDRLVTRNGNSAQYSIARSNIIRS